MELKLVDLLGLFGLMVVLLVAIGLASASRRRDGFAVDAAKLTVSGQRSVCALSGAQVDETCGGDFNVQKNLFFGDREMSQAPNGYNNTDPYFLGKVVAGGDQSSLRLTINDNADESFQIWGNACGAGNCSGPGALGHKFRADGAAAVAGSVVVGHPGGQTAADNGWSSGQYPVGGSLNVYNRHAGNWTHFPWFDGKNYIRNATQVDGKLDVNGTTNVYGSQLCIDGVCVDSGTMRTILSIASEFDTRVGAAEQVNGTQDGRLRSLEGRGTTMDQKLGALQAMVDAEERTIEDAIAAQEVAKAPAAAATLPLPTTATGNTGMDPQPVR